MATYVVDIDGTLCHSYPGCDYSKCDPITEVVDAVNWAYDNGAHIILFTARGMRSYEGNIPDIEVNVKPVLEQWLKKNGVKYHELIMGKPWAAGELWYIDDKNMSISEFINSV